jgi:hypothetical protein
MQCRGAEDIEAGIPAEYDIVRTVGPPLNMTDVSIWGLVKCKRCPRRLDAIDNPPRATWICDPCLGVCYLGLKLDLHPCHHCGLFGQEPLHPDCTCSARLKFDCPCNPGAVAFPLILYAGGRGPKDWVHPNARQGTFQEQNDKDFVKLKVQEAKKYKKLDDAKATQREGLQASLLKTSQTSARSWALYELAAMREDEKRQSLRWQKLAVLRFKQELWLAYAQKQAAKWSNMDEHATLDDVQTEKEDRIADEMVGDMW